MSGGLQLDLGEARTAFVAESLELLDSMEAALLELERQPGDAESLNALFRAAHTIKGSGGIFGFDDIVSFTHIAENLLDQARAGTLQVDAAMSTLLLAATDHLRHLVDDAARGASQDAAAAARGAELMARMTAAMGTAPAAAAGGHGHAPAGPRGAAASAGAGPGTQPHWHLSLRFGPETIRDGFDPLSFVRYLGQIGQVQGIALDEDRVPPLAELEPDACHYAFDLALATTADQATIERVFDFVREDSLIAVLPPHSPLQAFRDLLRQLPDEPAALLERWQRCGSLDAAAASALLDEPTAAPAAAGIDPEGEPDTPARDSAPAAGPAQREARAVEGQTLRVDAAKLDHLIDLVGELIIAGSGAEQVARRHRIKDLVQATSAVGRLMAEVRDTALKLRMVQIGGTFGRFQRVVRDVSQELGKDIALEVSGGSTELDRTMVEKLADPLTHLVRNAMDHGIESAEQRAASGKPRQGTVRLHAHHEAGQVVIEVGDDGRGLSRQRIRDKAVERGLIEPERALSDAEIYNLVFQPGFSTAEQVSKLSGRGVGMDVVKRNIEALRGSIALHSTEGRGTTVSIRLPLTLAIIDGFLLGVGRSAYVVPLSTVVECIELSAAETAGRDWLDLRGEVLPLVRMRELHGIEGEPARRQNVVVVQGPGLRAGLVVDQLMGKLQTVIKPLGRVFQQVRGVGGFTILGHGEVALLLDVPNLIEQAARDRLPAAPPGPPQAMARAKALTHPEGHPA